VQAANPVAEKCVHFTREEGYWVDLPLLPLRPHEASRCLVDLVETHGCLETQALFTQAKGRHWNHFQDAENVDPFRRLHVQPLLFQEMLASNGDVLKPGHRWALMRPYYETLDRIAGKQKRLSELCDEAWFQQVELDLT
jgi:hypothetical protein